MALSNKGLWDSMVSLNQVVCAATGVNSGNSTEMLEALNNLEVMLQRHRPTFISLLRNPNKDKNERSTLQKSSQESVLLPGYSMAMKLPESLVQEALIISDMFDLSEMSSFSLLRSAEEEKPLYPGMPRGLVAVLFYHDGREQLTNAFKTLVQARQGISWTLLPNNEDLSCTITQYLEPILNSSLVDRILEIISNMDLTKEINLLQNNRALGSPKHRSMVIEKFKSVRLLLAETLFCWAAQTPLKRDECKRLLAYLSKLKLTDTKDGSIDNVNLTLFMALLYSIDASYLLASEDITEALGQFPITNDSRFIPEIHKEIHLGTWESKGLHSVVQLAWSVTLSCLRQVPIDAQLVNKDSFCDQDEMLLDAAMKEHPFQFIQEKILSGENLPLETFHAQKFHNLLTEFISQQFDRVKLMKTMADENARKILAHVREGLDPPTNLNQPYENLLTCLGKLYSNGQCGEAINEYWYDHLYSSTPFKSHTSRQIALYRFVRLPGDFLPSSLFVPYIKFLVGISTNAKAAQNVYNFLRLNNQPAAQGNLSWENFLNAFSQYYNNLRVQLPQSMHETVYRTSRSTHKCISPQELQGLSTVLHLLKEMATHDESARIALCNNTAWSPIYVFTGLLTCSISLSLKAELLDTLAAFSLSSSLAGKVWQAIENSKLVPAIDGAPGYSSRGLRQDIEEVESRCEEFPLSQAFLKLMLSLVKAGIPYQPVQLSKPAFKPYFELVIEKIFLPHDSRTYQRSEDRWGIARKCLELLSQLLSDYQPPPQNVTGEVWNHPSHMLLVNLVQDSRLFRQLLSVLHDSVALLEQYLPIPGQKDVEISLLILLEILLKIHKLQRHAMTRENIGDAVLMGVDRLLLSSNHRTGQCDHLLNISHVIGHHATLPRQAALACRLISLISSSPSGQSHLLPLLTTPQSTAVAFRQNFVQLLDHATLDEEHHKAAQTALELLKSSLRLPAPTLAHFLLGFVDGGSIRTTELRSDLFEPGVRGFPRTALHSVLSALPSLPPNLSESVHALLFILTSNAATSAATLRYLNSHDFIHQSLSSVGLNVCDVPSKMLSIGWLLRIAALDLRYHSSHQQRSQLRRLIGALVSGSDPDPPSEPQSLESSLAWNGLATTSEGRGILLSLLEMAELTIEAPAPLNCQFLTRAPELVKACEESIGGIKSINLTLLHQLLFQMIQESGSVAPNDPLENEVQEVLDFALATNQARQMLAAQKHFLESWRQLVEIAVSVSPAELTELQSHQSFLHTLTLELTRRLLDESAMPELSSHLVSTLLLLVTTLRTIHTQTVYSKISKKNKPTQALPSSLQLILRGIIDCLLRFQHSSQNVRASLYAALLNYLRIHADSETSLEVPVSKMSFLSTPKETIEEQFHRENLEALREDLPQLVKILSCEASAGHIICRLLSLSCLDAIAALERRSSTALSSDSILLHQLSEKGHLRVLIDAFITDDQNLLRLINEGSSDLRPLFLWETRASFFCRLALCSSSSATLLLQSELLTRLTEMQVFKLHPADAPDSGFFTDEEAEQSTLSKVYSGAMTGALRICMAVLTSRGPKDDSAVTQVLLFLASNAEAIAESLRILPCRSALVGALHQLSLITSVVAAASPPALYTDLRDPAALETAANTRRLRRQLLFLLPHFGPQGRVGAFVEELPEMNDDGECSREASRSHLLQIFANCLAHARDQLLHDDITSIDSTLLFQPSMGDGGNRTLTLGTLVSSLGDAAEAFAGARSKGEEVTSRLREIETAPLDALRSCVSPALAASASPAAVRRLAARHLDSLRSELLRQEEASVHAVESTMLLLFRHLQFYFKSGERKRPINKNVQAALTNQMSEDQMRDIKTQINVSMEEILPKVNQVNTLYSSTSGHVPFLEGCITRIKWLLAV